MFFLGVVWKTQKIFARNSLKLSFKLIFLTEVSHYCEERKTKLCINVYIKISRHLGSNFWNLGSNFLDLRQFFSNFLAFQWATSQHFKIKIGTDLTPKTNFSSDYKQNRERSCRDLIQWSPRKSSWFWNDDDLGENMYLDFSGSTKFPQLLQEEMYGFQ